MSSNNAASVEADRHIADILLKSMDDMQQGKVQPARLHEAYELSELAETEYGELTFDSRPQPGLRQAIVDAWYKHGATDTAFPDYDLHPITDKIITHGLAHELQGVRPLAVYNTLARNQVLLKTAVTLDLDPTELSDFDKQLQPHTRALRSGAYLATLRYLAGEPGSRIKREVRSHFRSQGARLKDAPYGDKLRHIYPGMPKSVFQHILDHMDDYNRQAPHIRPTIYEDGEIAAYLAYGFSPRKSRHAALQELVKSDYGESFAFRKKMAVVESSPKLLHFTAASAAPVAGHLPDNPSPASEAPESGEAPQEIPSLASVPSQIPILQEAQNAEPSPAVKNLVTRIARNGNTLIHVGRAAQDILAGRQSTEQAIRELGGNRYLYNPLRDMDTIDLQEVVKRGEESLRITLEKAHDAARRRFEQLITDTPELADYLDKAACLGAAMTIAFQKTFSGQNWNRHSSYSDFIIGVAYSQIGRIAAQASRELAEARRGGVPSSAILATPTMDSMGR